MTGRADKDGKRALFESPPIEIDDTLKDDPLVERHDVDGHEALYSAGHHEPGTSVILCSECGVRSRVSVIEAVVRIFSISVWIPTKAYSRWMQCPSCQQRTWCRIHWTG